MSDKTKVKQVSKSELKRSASARAKAFCTAQNYIWDWTESFNSFTKRRKDLFGLFDLVYIADNTMYGVQVTQHNGSARLAKMAGKAQKGESDEAAAYRRRCLWAWLKTGGRAEVWDYRHRKKGGVVVDIERVVLPLEIGDLES